MKMSYCLLFLLVGFFEICAGVSLRNIKISDSTSTSCQCGVFLLGTPPLSFSADASPALAGNPVAANCTSLPDRTKCSTSCRQLVQAMSSQADSPLVQTVVLAATRALACQKFNSSAKVPLPRIHIANGSGGRDGKMSEPKWLGGFYRWCDSHWVYAGVSVAEPLCCANGIPVKCAEEARGEEEVGSSNPLSNRSPRLIIKKRPEDDLSSEESDTENNEITSPPTSTQPSPTEGSSSNSNANETSMEKIEIFGSGDGDGVEESGSKLNSTILAEAFQFVGALMRSLGMADVVNGISTVLPTSTATELLKRVDVGGWVGKYQDKYIVYGREFNLGYCYLEYGLYNVANEGVGNIVSRVFGTGRINRRVRRDSNHSISELVNNSQLVKANGTENSGDFKNSGSKNILQATNGQSGKGTLSKSSQKRSNPKRGNSNRRQSGGVSGPNLLNMASMLMQLAGGANGNDGDKVNSLLQNALPLMGQVATSPMIQGVVSNLVTSFLTPPSENNRPPPPPQFSNNNNNNNFNNNVKTPVKSGEESNEIESLPPPSTASFTNNGNRPPPSGQSESGIGSMLGQIVQTYLKHYFSSKNPGPNRPEFPTTSAPNKNSNIKNPEKTTLATLTSTQTPAEEKSDIVEVLSEVAKPFFISWFGVVPGAPGFGQLNIAERNARVRDDTLTYDPDPGTSFTDLLFGSVNLPSTGNGVFDFGNRVVYSFSRANDPTQGMYCFKQYAVNKLWDGFRIGVKTMFK